MGSPGEPHNKGIDPTVGGLVWVRRRNGSWWPGQIIEVDENSESFMASPRSGTPIKLLGRDDASVDWYNLEKSKRVKSFRCGEYDYCIAKARRAAANSARKAVKYARREDAIIRALEIEMEQKTSGEHTYCGFSGLEGDDSSAHDLIEEPSQARPRRNPNDSEDEGVKRMRGLDDLGMGTVPAMKRKRTLVGHVQEFLKKKNRRRPLAKVLESTAMVLNEPNRGSSVVVNNSDSIGISFEKRILGNVFGDGSESGLVSYKHKENNISSISAIAEKHFPEKLSCMPLFANRTQPAGTVPKVMYQSSQVETVSLGNEELNESVSTSSGAAAVEEKAKSKWKLKGKRKSRTSVRTRKPFPKRSASFDGDFDNSLDEYWGWCGRKSQNLAYLRGPTASLNAPRSLPYRQSRFTMNPKYGPDFSMMNHDDYHSDLYEVILAVKANSRGQHVPYISLMSKLTGRPVVGHPLTVEVLEEGSTDDLCKPRTGAKQDLSSSGSERNMFVPEYEQKIGPKHLKSHRVSPVKSTSIGKSATSSKKIRKLSSLTGFNKLSEGARGLVAEKIMELTVACVPLKVVYSRLKASLRGSMRPPRRVRVLKPRKR